MSDASGALPGGTVATRGGHARDRWGSRVHLPAARASGSRTRRRRASPPTALSRALGQSSERLGVLATAARRWLLASPGESIRLQPGPPRRHRHAIARGLLASLRAWESAIRRRRAVAIVRRHLLAALALVLLVEIAVSLLGGDHRALWLFAPFALALADGALALRRSVGLARVAGMLDQSLGLRELVVTALEILGRRGEPRGLSAVVVEEARAATANSFTSVRVVADHARREWALIVAAVAALAVLAASPSLKGTSASRRGQSAVSEHRSSARAGVSPKPATTARRPTHSSTPSTNIAPTPLHGPSGALAGARNGGPSPYGHGANSLPARELAREGIAAPPTGKNTIGLLTVSEAGGEATGGTTGGHSTSGGSAGGKQSFSSTAPKAGSQPTVGGTSAAPLKAGSGARAGGSAAVGNARGATGSAASPAGAGSPGGNGAGAAPGSTELGSGLVPVLGGGVRGLPLQAGYAPSRARGSSGNEGISQTPNGGGGSGRSAHASGGETSVSGSLGVIPPSFNAPSTLDQGVLASYFGLSNQLMPGNW